MATENKIQYNNQTSRWATIKRYIVPVLGVAATVAIGVFAFLWLDPFAKKIVSTYKTSEVIATVTLIVTLSKCVWEICKGIFLKFSLPKKSISVQVNNNADYTIITSTIANQGTRRIKQQHIYLLVEYGVQPNKDNPRARFPFILKHEKKDGICGFCKACKKEKTITRLSDDLFVDKNCDCKNLFRRLVRLEELCQEGRLFLDPGEEFTQDIAFKLPEKGVYRATAIWISYNTDCICATKVFTVS